LKNHGLPGSIKKKAFVVKIYKKIKEGKKRTIKLFGLPVYSCSGKSPDHLHPEAAWRTKKLRTKLGRGLLSLLPRGIRQYCLGFVEKAENIFCRPRFGSKMSLAAILPGGIGDRLVSAAWLGEFYRQVPFLGDIDVVIVAKDEDSSITDFFRYNLGFVHSLLSLEEFNRVKSRYDVIINIGHFIEVQYRNDRRLSCQYPEFIACLASYEAFCARHRKYLVNSPRFDGAWATYCILMGWNRWDELGAGGPVAFGRGTECRFSLPDESYSIISALGLEWKKYVTIHSGMDSNLAIEKPGMKLWPLENWRKFCYAFKKKSRMPFWYNLAESIPWQSRESILT
jgi:hypothetical protein